ncbi:MAG: hypothetical protein HN742_30460 [Lentisphaerae bacterium]|jgi:hypothetical protein|nr:hypothetical protein [Lentisphaerota bacterium]MBT4822038.1 hypothetical protein [Lentisphaerota bacterium]MBT5605419.1 hypothetical protein [Lentisphaerota bacterium]MBT7060809.1 hypothetical protein [Lentisphaerota bacterium]MBT7846235.1 hypothetical protein [Lentisphaerota bacterium]
MTSSVVITVGLDEIDASGRKILDDEMAKLGLKQHGTSSEGHDLVYPEGTYVSELALSDSKDQLKHYYHSLVGVMKQHKLRGKYMVWTASGVDLVCGNIRNA